MVPADVTPTPKAQDLTAEPPGYTLPHPSGSKPLIQESDEVDDPAVKDPCTRRDVCKKDVCKKDPCKKDACKKSVSKNDACKKDACMKDACKKDDSKNEACKKDVSKNEACKNDTCDKVASAKKDCSDVIHKNVVCDICDNVIRGVRHKCKECEDYDLCEGCLHLAAKRHFPRHSFMPIEKPIRYKSRPSTHRSCRPSHQSNTSSTSAIPSRAPSQPSTDMVHRAHCDLCTAVIVGIRYKCFQCPDYDLCQECLDLAPIHHKGHSFATISYPGQATINVDQTRHPTVICDGCESDIYGIRYKCGNCADFDYCGNCEASPDRQHDPDHIFLKIRTPIPHHSAVTTPALLPAMYKKDWERTVLQQSSRTSSFSDHTERAASTQRATQREATVEKPEPNAAASSSVTPVLEQAHKAFSPLALFEESATSLILPKPTALQDPMFSATFVKDINLHDGTVIQAGSQFLKIWEMSNPGPSEWPKDTVLQYVGGDRMFTDVDMDVKTPLFKIPLAAVSESVCVTADLKAPALPGRYISYWRLVAPTGEPFGQRIWCDISVEECSDSGSDSVGSSTMIFPTVDYQDPTAKEESGQEVTVSHTNSITATDSEPRTIDVRTTPSITSAHTVGTVTATTETLLTDDQLSTMSGRFTARSIVSSIYGPDESLDGRTETASDGFPASERFYSDDDGFVVIFDSDDEDEA
ncbi:hypothetical protein BGZ99_007363 [Dissophora globulifera]|uniref:ZZ-type domain-containing protein n=1 Tax=Dissophora globulifera TaxID=979702 RepID=A0A9P6UPU8_9FUNG|nr:hypothetical protein BGZ99_007363 [Dissophora globulifera]